MPGIASNCTMTIVPPENSTPRGSPFREMPTTPARMITHDRISAGQRYLTKLKFGLWKICMAVY